MSKRFVEVKGIGIPNKGAELMLIALQEKISSILPDHYFCVEPTTDFYPRARYGLFQRTGVTIKGRYIEWSALARLIPERIRERYGLVTEDQVDIVIDASGFAYGDQWGAPKAHARLGKRIKAWKNKGKKVILLPQAFGPFNDQSLRLEMKHILEYADLVFARDKKSLAYINELTPDKAILSPDFTNLVFASEVPEQYREYAGRPCLIPNKKMITMAEKKGSYVEDMAACLKIMQDAGENPFILIHEGVGDLKLGEEISSCLEREVDIVVPNDALLIKAIIGQCSFLLSSRFHGLVSALSQGVPVVATGWSHKYYELMEDYGVADYIFKEDGGGVEREYVSSCVKKLLDKEVCSSVSSIVRGHVASEKGKSKEMWNNVSKLVLKAKK